MTGRHEVDQSGWSGRSGCQLERKYSSSGAGDQTSLFDSQTLTL